MSAASRLLLLSTSLLVMPALLSAQASSPSPTLPSDTLEANFAPRSASGPTPELAPTLPSDTLKATQPPKVRHLRRRRAERLPHPERSEGPSRRVSDTVRAGPSLCSG